VQAAGTEKHVPALRKIQDLQPVSLKLTKQSSGTFFSGNQLTV
jgi:hypothetical protein